ncbi:HPr kinase/phosphorylase [Sphingomonas bacterium]|uniref:HPr kinase/phosphorylase n=1 Tax=Sphingomonas bacterium TaxID=1895847 RepID=UPI001575267E|nr:HPr kinase/phosphatase C-terminal domain-containing protein [Sphingomonas bacterium]
MATISSETIHATCVAVGGRAVMIEGPSGAGKSDLALRLIDRGAVLISDDYTLCVRVGTNLHARVPAMTIAGRIEVRGLGIVAMPHADDIPVALLVRLDPTPERMPERRLRKIAGIDIRQFVLDPRPASATIKLELALRGETIE